VDYRMRKTDFHALILLPSSASMQEDTTTRDVPGRHASAGIRLDG
jgi:hypothetical protein